MARSALAWTLALPLALACGGCRGSATPEPIVAPQTEPALAAVEPVIDRQPGLLVSIKPLLEPSPALAVAIEVHGADTPDEDLRVWTMPGPIAAPPELEILDADGAVNFELAIEDAGLRLTLARAPRPPLTLAYALAPVASTRGGLARLELDEAHLFVTGEAALLLPADALTRKLSLTLAIDPSAFALEHEGAADGLPPLRAASSFAAEPETTVDGWVFELRGVTWVAGRLEWARFDSVNGDDRWLGAGSTGFDQRWSAAELAGVRAAIDNRIGMPTLDPLVTILRAGSHRQSEPAFRAQLRGRGLVIDADERAIWDVRARIAVAQALVRRWLGGRVRVWARDPTLAPELADAEALWFEAGVTRFVARELLWEIGLLDDQEYADELDLIEVELASSPLRDRSLAALAGLVTAGPEADPISFTDAQSQLVARGAAYAAWLDAELRPTPRGYDGVIEVLRVLVSRAVATERRDLELGELSNIAAHKLGREQPPVEALLAMFGATVDRGQRPPLPADTYGPCFRPRTRKLERFELGFVDGARADEPRAVVVSVDPRSSAAKAGLREGDIVVELDYLPGDAASPVVIEVERDGASERFEYLPAGPARKVVQWQRVAKIPPEQCVR